MTAARPAPVAPLDPLQVDTLRAHLGVDAPFIELALCQACGSTNDELLAAPPVAAGQLRVLATEIQTAGRGRRGRQWQSWPGGSLLFSVRWDCTYPTPPVGLSLAVGVAVAEALEDFGCTTLKLKWPNDLLLAGHKAGGILVEATRKGPADARVIGVGLNLQLPPDCASLSDVAALYPHMPRPPSRNLLLARLLGSLRGMLQTFDAGGFKAFADRWNARNAHADSMVGVMGEGAPLTGRCLGVDQEGALLLATPGGVVRVWSGDVSLRGAT